MSSIFFRRIMSVRLCFVGVRKQLNELQENGIFRRCFSNEKPGQNKKLFTPGPLGTSITVKQAMLKDLGSRDTQFIETVRYIRDKLVLIAGSSSKSFTSIPLQGSGTYAIEAVLQTSTPRRSGKVLILANGAYGKRMARICDVTNIPYTMLLFEEDKTIDLDKIKHHLESAKKYSTIATVHCETSSGIINPIEELGVLIQKYSPESSYFVDAMSSFGAVPINIESLGAHYLVSSANKCLEGVPGFSFVIANTSRLLECKGNSRSLSLDLVDQYEGLENSGQFRFTPPTHTMLAFKQALVEFEIEGGIVGRANRYKENNRILREGMKKLGFKELLKNGSEGYIITSFFFPDHPNFKFFEFYKLLNDLDLVIYPGKVSNAECFRIGNIGQLYPDDMHRLLKGIEKVCKDMKLPLPLTK